jgi:hypothetical protein
MESLQPGLNIPSESLSQSRKQIFPMHSVDEGMQIDGSTKQAHSADSPRFESLQPDSNVKLRIPAKFETGFLNLFN